MNANNAKLVKSGDALVLAVFNNAVAVITFDLKDKDVNLLSGSVMAELDAALDQLAGMNFIRGLVIRSGKPSFFYGANIDEIAGVQHQTESEACRASDMGKAVFAKIAALPYPTVALIHGTCLGGGTELALACKYRLASDDRKTQMGLPEVRLGFIPGWGGTVRLPKLVGAQAALELILQPQKTWDAAKAWRTGLVDEVVPADSLFQRGVAVASGAQPKKYRKSLKSRLAGAALSTKTPATVALALAGALFGALTGAAAGWAYQALSLAFGGTLAGAAAGSAVMAVLLWLVARFTPMRKMSGMAAKAGAVLGGVLGLLAVVFGGGALAGAGVAAGVLAFLGAAAGATVPFGRMALKQGAVAGIIKETSGNYPAPLAAVDVVLSAIEKPEAAAMRHESQAFGKLCVGRVSRNLVKIYQWTQEAKKLPTGVTPSVKVETVGVQGCGVMGSGIVQAAAYAGYKVVAYDSFPQSLERSKKIVKELFDGLVDKARKLTREEADRLYANISFTSDLADLAGCDLLVEAIIEEVGPKQDLLAKTEQVIKKPFIWLSNTSSLEVSAITAKAEHPDMCAGLHFFNPVHKMQLVEIVKADGTSDGTLAAVRQFASKLGKTAVDTGDAPLFVVNRILGPYLLEVIRLFEQGVPAEDIERAMVRFGMPMGPLALLDEVGFDVAAKVIQSMQKAFGDRFAPPALLGQMSALKLLGKKGGKGFYLYSPEGKRLGFNPELLAKASSTPLPKKIEEIQDRLALVMVNEAARVLSEGIVQSPDAVDLAMILGTGFAPFHGGVFGYADSVGVRNVVQKLELLARVSGANYDPAARLIEMAASGRGFYRS